MTKRGIAMRTILSLLLATLSAYAMADQIKNLQELALLPPYCRGTQQIRMISKDPKPIAEYEAIYGESYFHLHHYCWALDSENKAFGIRDKVLRESKLNQALNDIKYSLDHAKSGFVFLPDMYNSQARILFTLRRDPEAVAALIKAIEAKPDYIPAITRLSDYFVDIGNKAQAIKVLEDGIANTENASALIKKLAKLGKTYQGTPGSARKKESIIDTPEDVPNKASDAPLDTSTTTSPAAQSTPDTRTEAEKKANPYCRFCP
jgi:tetratricopeptide (TPR) repeat protein